MRLCSWPSVTVIAILCSTLITAGCATPAGSEGYTAFRNDSVPTLLTGSRPYADAARCFEEQAKFLPLAEFSRDAQAATFTYRLRLSGIWFEQVELRAAGTGSEAEIRLAPNLDARWRARFDSDRGGPLARCMAA